MSPRSSFVDVLGHTCDDIYSIWSRPVEGVMASAHEAEGGDAGQETVIYLSTCWGSRNPAFTVYTTTSSSPVKPATGVFRRALCSNIVR